MKSVYGMVSSDIGLINARRLNSPGSDHWRQSVQSTDPNRALIITIDSHVSEPEDVYRQGGISPQFHDRLPKMIFDNERRQFLWAEGLTRPILVKGRPKNTEVESQWERGGADKSFIQWSERMEPDDLERLAAGGTKNCDEPTLVRMRGDMDRDGVDAAVLFANRGLMAYATQDPAFQAAMCRAFNVWAASCYGAHSDRFKVAALISTMDVELAIKELEWAAKNGFTCVNIPCKPLFGPRHEDELHYNHPSFDRFYAAAQDLNLTVCMHVGTGRDPRSATGSGGAVVNATASFLAIMAEPLAMMLASGVFTRFPKLRFVTVEAEIGWIPWLLQQMDHIYHKHHMWARPYGGGPPSQSWKSNCYASFIEDEIGVSLAKRLDLLGNVMWSNDYPHNEGSWPHSQQAIERQFQQLTDEERANILGFNAARVFGFDPQKLIAHRSKAAA
jgi:predicted TIM-barrel fold metal-dependent hydrolase